MINTVKTNGVIYKITNPKGRIYIGKTKNFPKRISYYKRGDCKTQPMLLKSILKYGWDNHFVEIIESAEATNIDQRERFWIESYKSNRSRYPDMNGLNCTDGGEGQCGRSLSDDARKRIGEANKGNSYKKGLKMPVHVKEALRAANIGRKLSDDHKEKISISLFISGKSRPCSVYHYKTNCFVGKYNSISEACRSLGIESARCKAYQVANGKRHRKQAKGYVFKYDEA